ncbi:MAG: hypothetical protein CMN31_14100 [Sandaracinus sp.]|nr:hypothetical protein [Myxococcales bacterium]MAT26654.1 hypothetical protein [Sandaracinus sp.]MBJ72447.1 hypothetical protein [Sandaracinus sp.]
MAERWRRRQGPAILPAMRVALALAAVLTAGLLHAPAAHAWCQSRDTVPAVGGCAQPCVTEGLRLQWGRPCIDYVIHRDGSRDLPLVEVQAIFDRSFATWLAIDCSGGPPGFVVQRRDELGECAVPEYVSGGGNANTMVFVDDWSDRGHASGAFALTTTWFSTRTGEIFDADMELNQQFWTFRACPEEGCADGSIDLENTVTHELGHFFGLAHTPDDPEATMWACADEGETMKRSLEADDVAGFCAIYDGDPIFEDECDFEPRGGFSALCGEDQGSGGGGCGCAAPGAGGGAGAAGGALALLALFVVRRRRGSGRAR